LHYDVMEIEHKRKSDGTNPKLLMTAEATLEKKSVGASDTRQILCLNIT